MIAGRYNLDREIGRGGMGTVWLAHDRLLGRKVAMKRIGHYDGAPDLTRAEREAKLAAKLNHPHVVAVFDYVVEGDWQWLVMEYVESTTLAELARKRKGLRPEQVAPIMRQAAEALAAAHRAGIVHRDVKPSNILVSRDGSAKLTDFGIARALADSTLTQTGMVTGSPAYLAPEVATGKPATAASDVWSFGATLFQALTGRPPYEVGDNVLGALYRIVHEEPPRIDAGALTPLLEATMCTDPGRRWSMAQVRDFLAGQAATPVRATGRGSEPAPTRVLAPTPVEPGPASRRGRRRGLAAALASVVLLVALGSWLVLSSGDDDAGHPAAQASPTSSPHPTSTGATEAGMVEFISDYANTVASDPQAAWQELTPEFQAKSGGLAAYLRFWDPVHVVRLTDVHADADAMTVSYHVTYSPPRPGVGKSDDVTLLLVHEDGRYLIADEVG